MSEKQRVSSSVECTASPETVYALVSDLPRMGEWSPENAGGHWMGGATRAAPGARFKGAQRQGSRKWPSIAEITDATPPSRIAWKLALGGWVWVEWVYEIAPTTTGCRVTETWIDHRGRFGVAFGKVVTGVQDRTAHTKTMIDTTLARLKAAAEATGSG